MKKILILLLLFVNLHAFISDDGLQITYGSTACAQHMYQEAGDNCYDEEIGWYHSPFSDCEEPVVTPCMENADKWIKALEDLLNQIDSRSHFPNQDLDRSSSTDSDTDLPTPVFTLSRPSADPLINKFVAGITKQYDYYVIPDPKDMGIKGGVVETRQIEPLLEFYLQELQRLAREKEETGGVGAANSSGSNAGSGGGIGIPPSNGPRQTRINTSAKILEKASKAFDEVTKENAGMACNKGVQKTFKLLFGTDINPDNDNMLANEICQYFKDNPSDWELLSAESLSELMKLANQYANDGYFVVCAYEHNPNGHVVVVLPGDMTSSKKYGCSVPDCMDTGTKGNRSESHPLSRSFGDDKKDDLEFYVYK